MAEDNATPQGTPENKILSLASVIITACLLLGVLSVTLLRLFAPAPETSEKLKPAHKKPDQNDYQKIIEKSKADYDSFMQQHKSRLAE
jgi:hypothetical protein